MKILGCILLLVGLLKAEKCPMPMEIAVLLDTSRPFSANDVSEVKRFLNDIGTSFHLAPHSSHISFVAAAGTKIDILLNFEPDISRKKLRKQLERMEIKRTGSWNLDRAFSTVDKEVFSLSGGARHFLPLILIVVTNGWQQAHRYESLAKAAKELHDKNVVVYSVGIGSRTPVKALRSMVGEEGRVFQAKTYQDLASVTPNITNKICHENEDSKKICNVPVDIGFIVDSSGSISNRGYKRIKNFMMGVSLSMGFQPGLTHVGVVLYSDKAERAFKFGDFPNTRKLFRAIHDMQHSRQRTRIDLGLLTANSSLFSKEGQMREEVAKVAILLTDGKQTTENVENLVQPPVAASALKKRGIRVFVVGIGSNLDQEQLLKIADDKEQFIFANTFEELEKGVDRIATLTCEKAIGAVINFTSPVYNFGESEDALVTINVTSGKINKPVTVVLTSRHGTAGGQDYTAVAQEVVFQPGETEAKSIKIPINDDAEIEKNETFTVSLSSSSPVILGADAVVNILDNDVPLICGTENDDCHRLATCRDIGPGSYQCKCNEGYVGDGKDCKAPPICGTERDDCHEHATCTDTGLNTYKCECNLGYSGDGKKCEGVVIAFRSANYSFQEDEKDTAMELFIKSGKVVTDVTARVISEPLTAGEGDFARFIEDFTFRPGETGPKPVKINLIDDRDVERTESFRAVLSSSSPSVKVGDPAYVHILDNDEAVIGFTKGVYDVKEDENAVVHIGVSSGELGTPVVIRVATAPSTAKNEDFVPSTHEVVFNPGETGPKPINIEVVDDPDVELTEQFKVLFTSSSLPGHIKFGKPAIVNIIDNDEAIATFTKSVYNTKENESPGVAVQLSSARLSVPVTIRIAANPSTAGNRDFVQKTLNVTFNPGETGPIPLDIQPVDDLFTESTEQFHVSFISSSLLGVKLGKAAAVNILDNDEVAIGFTKRVYDIPENENARVQIQITSGELSKPVIVSVSTSPSTAGAKDFVPKTQDITFQPGETRPKSVMIDIVDDGSVEVTEKFTVRLSSNSSGVKLGGPATVNIIDNDEAVVSFTKRIYNIPENENAVVEMELSSGKLNIPVTIRVSTSPLTAKAKDYVPKTQDVTFQPGENGPKSVTIDVVDDARVEATEKFTVRLSSNSLGVKLGRPATVNILDNDEAVVNFTKRVYNIPENENAVVEIGFSSGKLDTPVTIRVSTSPSTAGAKDYVPKTQDVTFQPGETGPKSVTIDVLDDGSVEPTEKFTVRLSSNSSGVKLGGPATVNILDNDEAVVNFTKRVYNIPENENAVIGMELSSGKLDKPVTIRVSTSPLTAKAKDYVPKTQDVTFQPGENGPKSVTIDVVDDARVEATEKFTVRLSSNSLGVKLGRPATVNILDNDEAVVNFTKRVYNIPENENAVVEIGLSSGKLDTPVTIRASTSPSTAGTKDFVPKTQDVTFQPGETGPKSVMIDVVDDGSVEPTEKFTVRLSSNSSGVKLGGPATVNILDNDEAVVSFTKRVYNVPENKKAVVEMRITSGKLDSPVTIRASTSPSTAGAKDFVPKTQDVTFQPGETGPKSVVIDVVDDGSVEPTEKFTVRLSSNSSGVKLGGPATVNILDNDEVVIGFTKRFYDTFENQTVFPQIEVTSGSIGVPVKVRVATKSSTAKVGDFLAVNRYITFAPGETGPKSIEIIPVDDDVVEATEQLKVLFISSSLPNIKLGKPATVNIKDNDEIMVTFSKPSYDAAENGTAVVEVRIASGKIGTPVTIRVSTSPTSAGTNDFVPKTQDITFVPGESGPKLVMIEVIDDGRAEPTEIFTVQLSSNVPGVKLGKPAAVNILDNDVPKICGSEKEDCHEFATCNDTGPGSYECFCNEGYSGDGKYCKANTCALDLGFLVDSTGSMRNCNFETEKDFLKEIAGYFEVAPGASRTSLIVYSENASLVKKFSSSTTLKNFKRDVDDLPFQGGKPRLDKAMYLAASTMFTTENGMRSLDIPKVLLVLNDGTQTSVSQTKGDEIASMLRENEVRVVVVGVGEADKQQLSQLVATPNHLIMVDRFEDAKENLAALSKKFCPTTENSCVVVKKAIDLTIGGCVNQKPVKIGVCGGECPTTNVLKKRGATYEHDCRCCKPKTKVMKTVSLHCSMNTTQPFEILEATSCSCNAC